MTTPIAKIIISFPGDRRDPGTLAVYNKIGTIVFECPALGKADNTRAAQAGNPDRDPVLPYGDTPTGEYAETGLITLPIEAKSKLGPFWIGLDPTFGQAWQAKQAGRTGIGIHAGRGNTRLVPTYGCVRLFDKDMRRLHEKLDRERFRVQIEEQI